MHDTRVNTNIDMNVQRDAVKYAKVYLVGGRLV